MHLKIHSVNIKTSFCAFHQSAGRSTFYCSIAKVQKKCGWMPYNLIILLKKQPPAARAFSKLRDPEP